MARLAISRFGVTMEEGSGIQQKTGTSSDAPGEKNDSELKIAENKDALPEKEDPIRSAVGGEGNPKDKDEPDISDQALGQKKMDQSEMAADGDNWGGSECNDYEAEVDNDEAELESRADVVRAVTVNVEKQSTEMAATKLMEPDSSVEAMVARDDLNLLAEAPSKISEEATNQVETLPAEITSLKARLETSTRNEANLRLEREQLNSRMKTSAVELKEMTTKIDAMNATLAEVTGNKALLNAQLQTMTDDFAAERASLQSNNDQRQREVEELTAKLEEATRNEEAMNNRLQTVTDDFAAKHASLKSALEKEQSKIEDLRKKLAERQTEVNDKSESIKRLSLILTRKDAEREEKSPELH